ncbi:hypothetical protein [Azospirillum argentinense]|uniref:Uncharacterized protein n=1 Tax=Azospirillum argentinense TaxID=2970906 RepID=A0A5B0KMH8_9PROT|nr:hypothetical protein [Azospirillum argentinense]KAA1053802.1 hypothetical protein FH063_002384 [Azospirillum argentinense]
MAPRVRYDGEEIQRAALECAWALKSTMPEVEELSKEHLHVLHSIFNTVVWKYTERGPAHQKYDNCHRKSRKVREGLGPRRFDHSVRRETLISDILSASSKEELALVLSNSPTCVVTLAEHNAISARWKEADRNHENPSWKEIYRRAEVEWSDDP